MNSPFSVVSTFAGCGGSSLGYALAGGRVRLAVEWDDNAVQTYRFNFPSTPIYHGDIAQLSVDDTCRLAGIVPGQLDVLDGSPPCQGFSTAGKRQFHDPRNQLFREYVRLLRGLRPKVFVMENVEGLVRGSMKVIFADILRELKSSGYKVSARVLNAMYFNAPQSRERMIFIGVRDDLGLVPSHPKAQSRPISFRQACWDLRGNGPDDRLLGDVVRRVARGQPDSWSTDRKLYRRVKGNLASCRNLHWAGWDRVCGTLVRSEISLAGTVHPDRQRYLSLAEHKRLASFADSFQFTDRQNGIARIGNSVPPLFMKAIAEHIRMNILERVPDSSKVGQDL